MTSERRVRERRPCGFVFDNGNPCAAPEEHPVHHGAWEWGKGGRHTGTPATGPEPDHRYILGPERRVAWRRHSDTGRRSDPTGAIIGHGCAALGGAIVGGIVMWLLAWAVFSATPRPAADVVPPLTGVPSTTSGTSGNASTGLVSAVGSDAPYPASPRLPTGGAPLADGASASATSVVSVSAPSAAIGTALEAGTLKWVAPSHGDDYLALRAPRGTWARICAVTCVRMRSTDVGPVGPKAIADIAVVVWEKVCGLPRSAGVCSGTVEVFDDGDLPVLPATEIAP